MVPRLTTALTGPLLELEKKFLDATPDGQQRVLLRAGDPKGGRSSTDPDGPGRYRQFDAPVLNGVRCLFGGAERARRRGR